VNTVKTHLKSIYRKLGTSGRSATARRARELRLVPPAEADD
jgi:LuxR family transcriptional regulator, maltose regulon positive regulatory protein